MVSNNDAMLARVDLEISENKFYESMQHILTLVKRNTMNKKYDESMQILYKYALVYLDKKQYVLSGELMDEYTKVAESGSLSFTSEMVSNLINVFELPWKSSSNSSDFKESKEYKSAMSLFTKFMNRAILWSKSEDSPNGHPLLHKSLGEFYKFDKQYNKSQSNLVYSQDVELLFELVNEWKEQGNEEDGDFFYLRAVLMLLASNDVCNAKCFVYMLDYDLEDTKVLVYLLTQIIQTPLPIQFGYLLTESCESTNLELFNQVCETYKELIDMDKEYSNLVKTIKQNYFKESCNFSMEGQDGLENTLSNFIQALM